MKLYFIKRADYKLQPYNLLGIVTSQKNEIIGAIAFFRKKDAEKYMEELNKSIKYPLDYEIITVETKRKNKRRSK